MAATEGLELHHNRPRADVPSVWRPVVCDPRNPLDMAIVRARLLVSEYVNQSGRRLVSPQYVGKAQWAVAWDVSPRILEEWEGLAYEVWPRAVYRIAGGRVELMR